MSLDAPSLCRLLASCRWFSRAVKLSLLWKILYYQEFPLHDNEQELKWLWQFQERQRNPTLPTMLSVRDADGHLLKRRKEQKYFIDWYRAYVDRRRYEHGLSKGSPSKRSISVPAEYKDNNSWYLKGVNSRHLIFDSDGSCLVYRLANEGGGESNMSDPNRFQLLKGNPNQTSWQTYHADGDTIVIGVMKFENTDKYALIWQAKLSQPLRVDWPSSSDTDTFVYHDWVLGSVRQGWMIGYVRLSDDHCLTRAYNITNAQWCSGAFIRDTKNRFCHFHAINNKSIQVFHASGEQRKITWQLWEFYLDGANERCIENGVFASDSDHPCMIRSFRLSDKQIAVAYQDSNNASMVYFHQIHFTFRNPLGWHANVGDSINDMQLLGRDAMVVTTRLPKVHILKTLNGTYLRSFPINLNASIQPVLGSIFIYWTGTYSYLVDIMTESQLFLTDNLICYRSGSSECGMLSTYETISSGQLTLLDWVSKEKECT